MLAKAKMRARSCLVRTGSHFLPKNPRVMRKTVTLSLAAMVSAAAVVAGVVAEEDAGGIAIVGHVRMAVGIGRRKPTGHRVLAPELFRCYRQRLF